MQEKGEDAMTRKISFQAGYVSEGIHSRRGVTYVIRYRLRMADGRWKHKSETLYGLSGKKAAREVLRQRLRDASTKLPEAAGMTIEEFLQAYWWVYLDRRDVKPSTKASYECAVRRHILPILGEMLLTEVTPLHIETLAQTKSKAGLSHCLKKIVT
jgi:hypothetical protein